jgi:hypothetical protein
MRGSVYKYTRTTRKTQPVCRWFVCLFFLFLPTTDCCFHKVVETMEGGRGFLFFVFWFFLGGFIYSDCGLRGCCSTGCRASVDICHCAFFFILLYFFFLPLPLASFSFALSLFFSKGTLKKTKTTQQVKGIRNCVYSFCCNLDARRRAQKGGGRNGASKWKMKVFLTAVCIYTHLLMYPRHERVMKKKRRIIIHPPSSFHHCCWIAAIPPGKYATCTARCVCVFVCVCVLLPDIQV